MALSCIADKGVTDRRDGGCVGTKAHGGPCFFLHF